MRDSAKKESEVVECVVDARERITHSEGTARGSSKARREAEASKPRASWQSMLSLMRDNRWEIVPGCDTKEPSSNRCGCMTQADSQRERRVQARRQSSKRPFMQREVVSRAHRQIFDVKGSSGPDPFDGRMRERAAREFKFCSLVLRSF